MDPKAAQSKSNVSFKNNATDSKKSAKSQTSNKSGAHKTASILRETKPEVPEPEAPVTPPEAEEEAARVMVEPEEKPEVEGEDFFDRKRLFDGLKELEEFVNGFAAGVSSGGDGEERGRVLDGLSRSIAEDARRLIVFLDESQRKIETIRGPISAVTTSLAAKVNEITGGALKDSPELCHLDVQQKRLGQQLASLNDELVSATRQTAEAEWAALEAQRACQEACSIAEVLKQEADRRKKEMAEMALQKELENQQQLERELQEKKRQEELEALDRLQELELQEEAFLWPTFPLSIESANEFDGGIGCLVKTEPSVLHEGDMKCEIIGRRDLDYQLESDEEVVGNVVRLYVEGCECNDGAVAFNPGLCLSFPHCMPKQQGNSRELVVKLMAHEELDWIELKASERTFEQFKDVRFAQAQTTLIGTFVVLSRNKRSVVRVGRRGGTITTGLDSKVGFDFPAESLTRPEKLLVQMHPIETNNVKFLRKTLLLAHNLLSTSALFRFSWVNPVFGCPVKMTVPLPPNPAVLRKLARGKPHPHMKEEEKPTAFEGEAETKVMATTGGAAGASREEAASAEPGVEPEENDPKSQALNRPISWYLGIYDLAAEDESDYVFFLRKKREKWTAENVPIERTGSLDVVEVSLREPVSNFVLFRTTTRINSKDAETIMAHLDEMMGKKFAQFVVGHQAESPWSVVATVVPFAKVDKYLASLAERDFTALCTKEKVFMLREGARLQIDFRGNVISRSDPDSLVLDFFVNFDCSAPVTLVEHDIFVQKCYDVYRGFVQIKRKGGSHQVESKASQLESSQTSLLDEHLVTLPKNKELLAGKPIVRANVSYKDVNCDLKTETLVKLTLELEKEWLDLGAALGLSQVMLYTIESNAAYQKKPVQAKIMDMLKCWIKVQCRLSNKVEVLCAALAKVNRPDLVRLFELSNGNFDEESMKTEHTEMSKGSWAQE